MNIKKFLFEYNEKRYKLAYAHRVKQLQYLEVTEYDNAYLLPAQKEDSIKLFGEGGVVSETGDFCKESAIYSRAGVITKDTTGEDRECYFGGKYSFDENGAIQMEKTVVYMGYLNNHWGHFLIDFSTRLWFALEHRNENYQYIFLSDYSKKIEIIPQIKRFFEILGISDRFEIVTEITKCRKIIIPQAGYETNSYYSEQYINVFAYISKTITELKSNEVYVEKYKGKLIYYSRADYKRAVTCELGENKIVDSLKKNGYEIVSPEKLSLDEQVIILRNAKIVVATSGTLTHNVLFCVDNKDTEYVMLNKTYVINMVQLDLNKVLDLNVTHVDSYISKYPVTIGKGPFLYHISDRYIEWMHEYGYLIERESECELRKNLRKYEKLFRRLFGNYRYTFAIAENEDAVNYFPKDDWMDYLKTYYLVEKPIGFLEKKIGRMKTLLIIALIKISNKAPRGRS